MSGKNHFTLPHVLGINLTHHPRVEILCHALLGVGRRIHALAPTIPDIKRVHLMHQPVSFFVFKYYIDEVITPHRWHHRTRPGLATSRLKNPTQPGRINPVQLGPGWPDWLDRLAQPTHLGCCNWVDSVKVHSRLGWFNRFPYQVNSWVMGQVDSSLVLMIEAKLDMITDPDWEIRDINEKRNKYPK